MPSTNDYSANDIFKHHLMVNTLLDFKKSATGVRASQQQKATWVVTGELARESLPIIRGIFEVIIYSSFILIIPLLLLPSAWKTLGTYFGLLCWLQLWAPLNAVLNMVMTLFVKGQVYYLGLEGPSYKIC